MDILSKVTYEVPIKQYAQTTPLVNRVSLIFNLFSSFGLAILCCILYLYWSIVCLVIVYTGFGGSFLIIYK
jgi:hypothetical protein